MRVWNMFLWCSLYLVILNFNLMEVIVFVNGYLLCRLFEFKWFCRDNGIWYIVKMYIYRFEVNSIYVYIYLIVYVGGK